MEKILSASMIGRLPSWKLSLAFSLMIHLIMVLCVFFLVPTEKRESPAPFVTRLITPDELTREFPVGRPAEMPQRGSVKPRSGSQAPRPAQPRRVQPAMPQMARPIPPPVDSGIKMPEKETVPNSINKGTADQNLPAPGTNIPPPSPSLKEKLFDSEIVGKFAKKEEKKQDNRITFDTEEFKYESYMLKLKDRIESIWKYPQDAASRGIYGDLYLKFTIKKNGMLSDVELLRTSGYRNLDEAAKEALRDGQPFWPLPDEWGKDSLTITGHFIYSIYGTYIR